ncbi:MAG TPA: type II toxin-antitoxin system VapC family toxin [Chloroflexota bacterium]|jgi:predicted nucleic acid-binding protein
MTYLLDSDWIISFLNGQPNSVDLVAELADDGIGVSVITCGEIFEGLLSASNTPAQVAQFVAFLAMADVYAPDIDTARRYADIRADLRRRGLLLADNDLWIAATALAHDLTLVTRDQHFSRIVNLRIHPSA